MKASVLASILNKMVEENGDMEVQLMDYDYSLTLKIENIKVEPSYRMSKPKPYETSKSTQRLKGKDVIVLHSL